MGKDIRKSIESSKTWSLRRRVIMHALFHQLVSLERGLNPDRPFVQEYMTYSFDALTGFLHGKPITTCVSDIEVADEVFIVLYDAIDDSLDVDLRENPDDTKDTDESFTARTYISLAPLIINEYLAWFPEEEVTDCFDDILIDVKQCVCNSQKLLEFALVLGGLAYQSIENLVGKEPEIESEYDETDEDFLSDSGLVFYPNKPLYNLTNHRLALKNFGE